MYSYSYKLGFAAGYRGTEDICPFPLWSYEYYDWWDGYDDGEDEYWWEAF